MCIASAVLFGADLVDVQNSVFAAEIEEFTEPNEGEEVDVADDITIKITGEDNTDYTIKLIGSTSGSSYNVTTDAGGTATVIISSGVYGLGEYILQLRAGHDNTSGPTLDTITFQIVEVE